jgi:hypothetical protein
MWIAIGIIWAVIAIDVLLIVSVGRKKTPKPGRDYDERGPY